MKRRSRSTVHEPAYVPMRLSFDLASRRARFEAEGVFETVTEPIKRAPP